MLGNSREMTTNNESDAARQVLQQMQELWLQRQLCDVELRAGTATIPCHKLVLAASSPFFSRLFLGAGSEMLERDASSVELHQIDGDTLASLVESLYGTALEARSQNTPKHTPSPAPRELAHASPASPQVSWDNAAPLLFGATQLGLQPQADACCAFLRSSLSPESVVSIAVLASEIGTEPLLQTALEFLSARLSQARALAPLRAARPCARAQLAAGPAVPDSVVPSVSRLTERPSRAFPRTSSAPSFAPTRWTSAPRRKRSTCSSHG